MVMDLKPGESPWLIAVHGGAGYHSSEATSEKAIKQALRSACTAAVEMLQREGKGSVHYVERAISSLEDNECLNAGYGSNLTIDGTVECDASIMDGITRDFGSAGAVQGVRNPISLARAIMQNSTRPQPLGRVPPLTLVGPGANAFAASSGIQLVEPNTLISNNARREWQKWKAQLEGASSNIPGSETQSFAELGSVLASATAPEERRSILEDTVGAVACDVSGGLAAGVSSGGLLLKYPGRIGEMSTRGSCLRCGSLGAFASGYTDWCSMQCIRYCLGTGEAIIRTAFARTLAEALIAAPPEEIHNILQSRLETFCEEIGGRGEEPNVGVLLVTKEPIENENEDDTSSDSQSEEDIDLRAAPENPSGSGAPQVIQLKRTSQKRAGEHQPESAQLQKTKLRLWCAFTTESMAIAYASSEYDKPRAFIMRHRTYRNTDTKRGIHIAALPLPR